MKTSLTFQLYLVGLALAQDSGGDSLTDVLSANNDTLSALGDLLQGQEGLLSSLADASNITVLAPSNDALESYLNSSSVTSMVSMDPGIIQALLQYHVLNGTFYKDNITDTPTFVPTLLTNETYTNVTSGQAVEAVSMDGDVSFYSALRHQSNVTKADISFSGGVIHVINEVLHIPMNLSYTASDANLTAAAGALTRANLVSDLDSAQNITVFAPNNDAFSAIASVLEDADEETLASILQYHVIEGTVGYSSDLMNGSLATAGGEDVNITVIGDEVYVDSARVIIPNVLISNGVLHVIDRVLNPDSADNATEPNPSTTVPAFTGASSATDGGIPLTSGVRQPSEAPTGLDTTDSEEAGPQMTAAVAMGALLGGAALLVNGL